MQDPSLSKLVGHPQPEIAAALRHCLPQILEDFRQSVTSVLPSADQLTLSELYDHLPETLEDLARLLDGRGATAANAFLRDSRHHGVCRYHQNFDLGELLLEYAMLRSILLKQVSACLKRPLETQELIELNAGLDAANRRAVEKYVAYQSELNTRLNESQSKYLSFLSHDLRGSLNGILLMMEVLRRQLAGTPQLKESLDDMDLMRRSILETVSTMDRFLYAERFRHGKIEVRTGVLDLTSVLNDIVSQYQPQAVQKGLKIAANATGCPTLTSDRELLMLILQNLVGNAIKYSESGQVTITAEMADGLPQISVRDQGPGIEPGKLPTIFQPFTRGDDHGQQGSGLGLSIAMQAAEFLKSRLTVESNLGKGSVFCLHLPATAIQ